MGCAASRSSVPASSMVLQRLPEFEQLQKLKALFARQYTLKFVNQVTEAEGLTRWEVNKDLIHWLRVHGYGLPTEAVFQQAGSSGKGGAVPGSPYAHHPSSSGDTSQHTPFSPPHQGGPASGYGPGSEPGSGAGFAAQRTSMQANQQLPQVSPEKVQATLDSAHQLQ
ncbi:hypothetical protein HaLaN_30114, partial [Haematococcus lacustris]